MEELKSFITSHFKKYLNPEQVRVEKLFGQASTRQYFRAYLPEAEHKSFSNEPNNFVIMKMPQGFASPAEEITKVQDGAPEEFPFLNVQRYLKKLDVMVPNVLAVDADQGLILLEDLGDQSLEKVLSQAEDEFFVFYYKKVIDVLVDLQSKTLETPDKGCVAYYRHFNEELLNWEFDHFLEFGIEDRFSTKVSDEHREVFQEKTREISHRIASMPKGFVHRDFQSRNLMFHNYHFYVIDFQDALVGPVVYDLVGLLRDSYIKFTPDHLHQLIEYYYHKLPGTHPYSGKLAQLKEDFHVMALQRKLKDTGRFQYIKTVKNNDSFLTHVPLSLQYVNFSFAALPEYDSLREMISQYVTELK